MLPNTSNSEFGPEFLFIFVGYSSDGNSAAETIVSLEPELQRELDKLRRVNPSVPFNRVKIWRWDTDASPIVGGQAKVITPNLQRANIAVFVFNERVGKVAWEELNLARQKNPSISVLPFFPANPPSGDRMMIDSVAEEWTDLLKKKRSLAAGWTDPESNAVTPLPQYKDLKDLGRIASERLVTEVVRLAGAFAVKEQNGISTKAKEQEDLESKESNTLIVGKKTLENGQQEHITSYGKENVLSIAPFGPGRYTATIIPTLSSYNGSALVLDPTGQIYKATANIREKKGQIVKLDPWGLAPDARVGSLNPFDIVNGLGMSLSEGARFLADILTPYSIYNYRRREMLTSDPFWPNMQRKLMIGLIILAASESQNNEAIFSRIRNILNDDDVTYNFAVKLDTKGKELKEKNPEAYHELSSFLQQPDTTRLGIIAGVNQHMSAFGSIAVQRSTDSSSFDVGQWIRGEGNTTIYIIGPHPGIGSFESIYRLWLGSLLAPVLQRPVNQNDSTLIVLDINESFQLWPGLASAITIKTNSHVWAIVSDLSDLELAFGAAFESVLNSFALIQALRPNNHQVAEKLGKLFGVTPRDVMGLKPSEILTVINGGAAIRATRLDYE